MTTNDPAPGLPAGLATRPLTRSDARAVYQLMADAERHDVGSVEIEESDIVADWQRPSYDLATSSVGVLDGDRLVAYAELVGVDRYDATVHPDARGRGIGTWLAAWIRDLARSRGATVVGMPVPQGSAGDRLLDALGYHIRWHSWVLRLPEGRTIDERPLPDGYRVRIATPADHEQVWHVTEDAFLEWSEREKESLADFAASVWQRPGFEPWNLMVVTAPDGAVVGTAFSVLSDADGHQETYIDRLAVHREHRNRGLAQALLVAAFTAGREHGATDSCLSTDSRTGALTLYEKVGMKTDSVWVNRAIAL